MLAFRTVFDYYSSTATTGYFEINERPDSNRYLAGEVESWQVGSRADWEMGFSLQRGRKITVSLLVHVPLGIR
jgi:hypothetical protein